MSAYLVIALVKSREGASSGGARRVFRAENDWNPIIFHYYCFGAGIPFRGLRLDIYWACAALWD